VEFYSDITDLVQATEYLSDADHLTSVDWLVSNTVHVYKNIILVVE